MITCYLDSQDYSSLTDPKLDAPDRREIRNALIHLAHTHQVRFVFSAAAISEIVALTPDSSHLSELRADLLYELCGSNALVSFTRLVRAEVNALSRKSSQSINVIDPQGRWFPDIPIDEKSPYPLAEMVHEIAEDEMNLMGLSRKQRRAMHRSLIKNERPRGALLSHLNQQNRNVLLPELLKKYPMRSEDAEVMVLYVLGRATEKDFTDALTKSLTDPRWMMKWFTTQHGLSGPIADIVRKPGRELGQLMRSLADNSMLWADELRKKESTANPTGKNGEIRGPWLAMEDQQLIRITQFSACELGIDLGEYNAKDVEIFCPGIATGIRALLSSVWANVGEGRKEEPSDSQPVDALHSLYAPYVQVFRADRFMAPHIQKQLINSRTTVVPRLSLLVGTLEKLLH
jgi:hypothetical protein